MSSYRGYITSAKKFWAKGRKKLKDVRDLDGFFEKSVSQQISLLYKMAEVETVEEQVTSHQVGLWGLEKNKKIKYLSSFSKNFIETLKKN